MELDEAGDRNREASEFMDDGGLELIDEEPSRKESPTPIISREPDALLVKIFESSGIILKAEEKK